MREFSPTMIEVDGSGHPLVREPLEFSGRVSEATLEAWLIEHPNLAGEPLLILGSQLAEFAEDKDRLDVLAVDTSGELVLIELKVDEGFRVTELQALAYAGALMRRCPRPIWPPCSATTLNGRVTPEPRSR